jgi:KDO2-lipid IV(A) lauroyltransferase
VDPSPNLRALLEDLRQHDSVFWRRAVEAGVTYGPDAFVRYSPALFGLVFAAALPRYRAAVRKNLRLALGPRSAVEEHRDVARVFVNFAACLTEAFMTGSARGYRLIGVCVNDQHYVDAASRGAGVIFVTAHTGGWYAAGPLLQTVHAADVLVVMQRERDARAQAVQDTARDRAGVRVHRASDDPLAALPLLAHLRRGGVVAAQIDRLPPGMRGRQVPLFGVPWRVPEGPLHLAAASGAPVLPVFTRRVGFMHYEVLLSPPIEVPRRPSAADLDVGARRIAAEMERFVRAHPTQWFHFA